MPEPGVMAFKPSPDQDWMHWLVLRPIPELDHEGKYVVVDWYLFDADDVGSRFDEEIRILYPPGEELYCLSGFIKWDACFELRGHVHLCSSSQRRFLWEAVERAMALAKEHFDCPREENDD